MADKIYIDNGNNPNDYEVTDSEDEYSEEEKQLLANVRKGKKRKHDDDFQIMAFSDDSSDSEDSVAAKNDHNNGNNEIAELMADSDIEGAEANDDDISDPMDWGQKKSNYYNTDFIDRDFNSFTAQEEELAKAEESEAKNLQIRLAKQLNEADFQIDEHFNDKDPVLSDGSDDDDHTKKIATIKVKADLAGLSKIDRFHLLQKDSPEFIGLTKELVEFLTEAEALINPVTIYAEEHELLMTKFFEFVKLYENLALTFTTNISFYLLLKAQRQPAKNHPITKRLLNLKELLEQLQERYKMVIKPQLEALLERINDNDPIEVVEFKSKNSHKDKKRKLQILDEFEPMIKQTKGHPENDNANSSDNDDEELDGDELEEKDGNARRGITYQIAKNKGLTPHRKKEQRNPRVKHRGKYRKAMIRRKGAVRTVRKEIQRYSGEISGIKSTVVKSVKFKS